MKIRELERGINRPVVLALGHFDGVHIGHRKIIEQGIAAAKSLNARFAITTFSDSPNKDGEIYPYEKRCKILETLGVGYVIKLSFSDIRNMPGRVFFETITKKFNIAKLISGPDYMFGSDRLTSNSLRILSESASLDYEVADYVTYNGEKVSSTRIKKALLTDISLAGALLGQPFEYDGVVVKGRGVGRKFDFPTANTEIYGGYAEIKHGVYGTEADLDGKTYKAVTNYGAGPTFGRKGIILETNIIGMENPNIYGKPMTVRFIKFLRDIKKFANPVELKEQIDRDREWIYD